MAASKPVRVLLLLSVLLPASCAAPKALVVEEPKKEVEQEPVPEVAELPETVVPEDDLRLPDLLTMPGDDEFRSSQPAGEPTGTGAVIARPPTDPPPRPKNDE